MIVIWIFSAANFFILVTLLARYLRRPMTDAFRRRRLLIAERMTAAARRLETAERTWAEIHQRERLLALEIAELTQALAAAEAAERRLLSERAQRLATRIQEDAARQVTMEATRARQRIFREALLSAFANVEKELGRGLPADRQQRILVASLGSLGALTQFGQTERGHETIGGGKAR